MVAHRMEHRSKLVGRCYHILMLKLQNGEWGYANKDKGICGG